MLSDKQLGAIYGALVGDACGCPYEFKSPLKLPPMESIDMVPPSNFNRTYPGIEVGTYTDDGAQTLCLLEALLEEGDLLNNLTSKMRKWLNNGYLSVDSFTFDIGMQTQASLRLASPELVEKQLSDNKNSGNGSLMRCIPAAVLDTSLYQAMDLGMLQSRATHPSNYCQIACAAYAGIGWLMLNEDADPGAATTRVFGILHTNFHNKQDLGYVYNYRYNEPTGTGFVVDAFWSALYALNNGKDYEHVIKTAIALGNDTDTTACIAGGLAGIKFGYSGIPSKWLDLLRGKELIEPLIDRLEKALS